MSTIRILAREVKEGALVQGERVVMVTHSAAGKTCIAFGGGSWDIVDSDKPIRVELEEAHPIAVLERLRDRVEEQRKANHQEFLEAVRTGDEGRKIRREADAKLLQGKLWGLGYAIMELRAGIEYYPGK